MTIKTKSGSKYTLLIGDEDRIYLFKGKHLEGTVRKIMTPIVGRPLMLVLHPHPYREYDIYIHTTPVVQMSD